MKNRLHSLALWWAQTVDLLDVVIVTALALQALGVYLLWGVGWACLIVGSILLALVLIGIPVKQKSS